MGIGLLLYRRERDPPKRMEQSNRECVLDANGPSLPENLAANAVLKPASEGSDEAPLPCPRRAAFVGWTLLAALLAASVVAPWHIGQCAKPFAGSIPSFTYARFVSVLGFVQISYVAGQAQQNIASDRIAHPSVLAASDGKIGLIDFYMTVRRLMAFQDLRQWSDTPIVAEWLLDGPYLLYSVIPRVKILFLNARFCPSAVVNLEIYRGHTRRVIDVHSYRINIDHGSPSGLERSCSNLSLLLGRFCVGFGGFSRLVHLFQTAIRNIPLSMRSPPQPPCEHSQENRRDDCCQLAKEGAPTFLGWIVIGIGVASGLIGGWCGTDLISQRRYGAGILVMVAMSVPNLACMWVVAGSCAASLCGA